MEAIDIFRNLISPEQQFDAAQAMSANLVSKGSAARLVEEEATKQANEAAAIVEQEKTSKLNEANKKANAVIDAFGPDELVGKLASTFRQNTDQAIGLRKQYDKLNAVSFLDNPLEFIVNAFQKDSLAEQINSLEGAADSAAESMSQLSTLRTQAGEAAKVQANTLSDTAIAAKSKALAESNRAVAAKLEAEHSTADLNGISHLQQGAIQKVQMAHAKASLAMQQERLAMDKAHEAEWQREAPIRAMEAQARIANAQYNIDMIPLRKDELELKRQELLNEKELMPLKKKSMELQFRQLSNAVDIQEATKQDQISQEQLATKMQQLHYGQVTDQVEAQKAELNLINAGAFSLGLPKLNGMADLKNYSDDQIQKLKIAGGNYLSTGMMQMGDTAGQAMSTIVSLRIPKGNKTSVKTYDYITQLGRDAYDPKLNPALSEVKTQAERDVVAQNYVTKKAADAQKLWESNAERADSLYKAPNVFAVLATNGQLRQDKAAKAIFEPLTATHETNNATDFAAIAGRIKAAIDAKEVSEADAMRVGSLFYKSAMASNNAYGLLTGYGLRPQQSYVVEVNGNKYDLTDETQFRQAMIKHNLRSILEGITNSNSRFMDPFESIAKVFGGK